MRADIGWTEAHVRTTRDLTPSVRLIEFVPETGGAAWSPGGHLDVGVVVDGRADVRSYSLVGEPDSGCFRIAVQREDGGRGGSRYMWSLTPGSRLTVSAPRNLFELELGRPEYLLVAGGIGITPMVGMAHALERRGARFRLAYAGRSRRHMPLIAELARRLGERLSVHASDEGSRLDLAGAIARLHPDAQLYVCGPMRLLDAGRKAWAEAGRPPTALRYETFANSGRHAIEPFFVRIPNENIEIMVPENKTMLDALVEAGVDVMWDCRRGECGICAIDVIEVVGGIDHRDVFLSDGQKRRNGKICTCVSRGFGGGVVIDAGYRPD